MLNWSDLKRSLNHPGWAPLVGVSAVIFASAFGVSAANLTVPNSGF
jgi:hypothetical protein